MNTTPVRISLFFLVFISVTTLPWWISALILIGLTIYFPFYLEGLFFGFLFDTLYSTRLASPYTGLTLATIFLLLTMLAKTQIRR